MPFIIDGASCTKAVNSLIPASTIFGIDCNSAFTRLSTIFGSASIILGSAFQMPSIKAIVRSSATSTILVRTSGSVSISMIFMAASTTSGMSVGS